MYSNVLLNLCRNEHVFFLLKIRQILAQIFCSRGRPVELLLDVLQILLDVQQDSTGRPLEFCKFASNVLELLISSRNAIKISTGRPVEFLLDVPQNLLDVQQNCSTGRPLEQKIWPNISVFHSYAVNMKNIVEKQAIIHTRKKEK